MRNNSQSADRKGMSAAADCARYIDALLIRDEDDDLAYETDYGGGDLGMEGSGLETRQFYLQDAGYSTRYTLLPDATMGLACDYSPYGDIAAAGSHGAGGLFLYQGTIIGWTVPGMFHGYEWDLVSCMHHVRNRSLNIATGRWQQRDPLGYIDGMSLYQYVKSGPTRYVDPMGLTITKFKCCSDEQKQVIEAAHDGAEKRLAEIKDAVDRYTYAWVLENYVIAKGRRKDIVAHEAQTPYINYRRDMMVTIKSMQDKFDSGIPVECEKKCDEDTTSYVKKHFARSIHFCPPYFEGSRTEKEQGAAFLHELSHLAANTKDYALNWGKKETWCTVGGFFPNLAAHDAYWFGYLFSGDLEKAHENFIWSVLWPPEEE